MAAKQDHKKRDFNILDGLSTARLPNQYSEAVRIITGESLPLEEAKAFLLYLVESTFDPGDERDIVLVSWGLVRGFETIEKIQDRHQQFMAQSSYSGKPSGLYHKELYTLYPRIELRYQRVLEKKAFISEAIKAKLPNRKGTVQLPELCNKKEVEPTTTSPQPLDEQEEVKPIIPSIEKIPADKDANLKKRAERQGTSKCDAIKPWQLVILAILGIFFAIILNYYINGPGKERLAMSRLEECLSSVEESEASLISDPTDGLLIQLQKDIEDLKIESAQFDELSSRAEAGDMEAAYQLGLKSYTKGDYEATYDWLKVAAESGHSQAQVALGALYMDGVGVEKNLEEAFGWTMKAAEQGNPSGENNIGYMYQTGAYVDLDYDKAFAWYQKAAEQGLDVAFDNLGVSYFNGWGTEVDYVKALECFVDAYNAGFDISADHIAFMYQKGYGVKADIETAIKWYTIGADNDDPFALAELGKIYEKGDGVPKDLKTAFEYYYRSADLGYTWAMRTVAYWYYTGQYVDKDYDETLKWLTRASEAGDEKAAENLRQFEETLALLGK